MLTKNYTSNAKINLGLRVLNQREDGYHNLKSIFIEVNLSDELIFTPATKFSLIVEDKEKFGVPLDKTNLITKSYNLIKSKINRVSTEFNIRLKKIIPIKIN